MSRQKLGSLIVSLAAGNLFLSLVFIMIASIILGMGLPTSAKYIVLATMAVPALIQLNVPLLAAHMFVFYFGILAEVTPPVALASYAAAGIAGAQPLRTGITALKLAGAGFIIPYIFVYAPALLLIDVTFLSALVAIISACIGTYALGSAIQNYCLTDLRIFERLLLAASAVTLINPGIYTDTAGVLMFLAAILLQRRRIKRNEIQTWDKDILVIQKEGAN